MEISIRLLAVPILRVRERKLKERRGHVGVGQRRIYQRQAIIAILYKIESVTAIRRQRRNCLAIIAMPDVVFLLTEKIEISLSERKDLF